MPSCGLIPLYKALAPRKGDAASVRRQSRQRLRSERRYRRNRSVRFYRHLVRTGSAFPRLPRAQSALAMTNRGPLPFYRYPIRIGGAAPGAACRSPTMHGRRSVYFSFFIFQSSGFISMRPSPTMHGRKPRAALHVPFSSFRFHRALPLHITLQISSFYGKSTKIRGGTRNVR